MPSVSISDTKTCSTKSFFAAQSVAVMRGSGPRCYGCAQKKKQKEKIEMNIEMERRALQGQIDQLLSKSSLTPSESKQADLLMSRVALLRDTEDRQARAKSLVDETRKDSPVNDEEHRAAKYEGAFNRYLRGAGVEEIRSYAPLSTSGVPLPQLFLASYGEALKSFSGIREVATVISSSNGDPLKSPFSDDTANSGERLNESDLVSLANPTFSDTVFGAYRYASKGVQYSAQLLQDAGIDVGSYLSRIFAARIGRITNQEYTLGGAGAMTGVIPSISTIQTTAGASVVTITELVTLQGGINAGYLPGSVYMFSPATERILKAMTASGLKVFPEMNEKMLLGYPYTLNTSMADLAASAKSIAFGNFKLGVVIREVVPQMLVSRERYAEMRKLYASLTHSQDCQVVDANALAVLQQHS
jgi:HK97 family phage major capsid protein